MNAKLLDCFIYLLKCAVHKYSPLDSNRKALEHLEKLEQEDWYAIANLAGYTYTIPLLLDTIAVCSQENRFTLGEDVLDNWHKASRYLMLGELQTYNHIYALQQEADRRGIPILFVKGIILADLYPQFIQRCSSDSDLWTKDIYRDQASKMLEDLGYTKNESSSKSHVQVYIRENPRHMVELHTRLWEDFTGKTIDILSNMGLTDETNWRQVKACNIEVTTLAPHQHLVYQIFHIVKHLMLEGVTIRQLIDVVLFVNRYGGEIDKNRFWEDMGRLGYTTFCTHLFTLGIVYFDMDSTILNGRKALVTENTLTLLQNMVDDGSPHDKAAKWQMLGTMTPYLTGEKRNRRTYFGRMVDIIFLRPKDLTEEYRYAKRFVVLLPIAWVHRAYSYLHRWLRDRKNTYNVNEKLDIAEHRLQLLEDMGLGEEEADRAE